MSDSKVYISIDEKRSIKSIQLRRRTLFSILGIKCESWKIVEKQEFLSNFIHS